MKTCAIVQKKRGTICSYKTIHDLGRGDLGDGIVVHTGIFVRVGNFLKLFKLGFRFVQNCSNLSDSIQSCLKLFKLVQIGLHLSILVYICLKDGAHIK